MIFKRVETFRNICSNKRFETVHEKIGLSGFRNDDGFRHRADFMNGGSLYLQYIRSGENNHKVLFLKTIKNSVICIEHKDW